MINYIKKTSLVLTLLSSLLLSALSTQAYAHSRWILPSQTNISTDKDVSIAVDVSVSNDIFHADRAFGGEAKQSINKVAIKDKTGENKKRPRPKVKLFAIAPDGSSQQADLFNFARKSVAQVDLTQDGTYKLLLETEPRVISFYDDANGKTQRFMGAKAEAKKELGDNLKNIQAREYMATIVTYVTRNNISKKALKPSAKGLELSGETHPNDLFNNEKAKFKLLVNGKAAPADIEVTVIQDGTKHRNDRNVQTFITDKNGDFEVKWVGSGFYLLEAHYKKEQTSGTIDALNYSLFVTLEVSPE